MGTPSDRSSQQRLERDVPRAVDLYAAVAEWRAQAGHPGEGEPDRLPGEQRTSAGADARPFELHGHGDEGVLLRRQVERRLEQGVAEMHLLEIDSQLEPGRLEAVVVGVEHVERQVERPPLQPQAGHLDLLQLDVRLLKMQGAPQGGTSAGQQREPDAPRRPGHSDSGVPDPAAASRLRRSHHSTRSFTVFSYPLSVGSYQRAPRSASGRYSCAAYAPS